MADGTLSKSGQQLAQYGTHPGRESCCFATVRSAHMVPVPTCRSRTSLLLCPHLFARLKRHVMTKRFTHLRLTSSREHSKQDYVKSTRLRVVQCSTDFSSTRQVSLPSGKALTRFELVSGPAGQPECMAAFGHALNSSLFRTCVSRQQPYPCAHLQLHTRGRFAKLHSNLKPAVLPSYTLHLPVQLKRHTFLPRRQAVHAVQANAAGDIALPGPAGHAESVRIPESGLIKSSWLKCRHDSEIFGLAIPALGSILLDPLLSLVDTGNGRMTRNLVAIGII